MIGLDVKEPKKKCKDKNCPFHGTLKVRGRVMTATVVSDKMDKTVVVRYERPYYVKKYERYEIRSSKIHAHNPPCIDAKEGDVVRIAECRPLSKSKKFVVVEVVKHAG